MFNNAIFRREDRIGVDIENDVLTPADGVFEFAIYQLADPQGSIVATMRAPGMDGTGSAPSNQARLLDEVEYEPYGSARRIARADFNRVNGQSIQDLYDFLDAEFAGSHSADINDSGTVSPQDIFDFLDLYFAVDPTPRDVVSGFFDIQYYDDHRGGTNADAWLPVADNPYGYCGYHFDAETAAAQVLGPNGGGAGGLYQVRFRVYDPISGRWLSRDPAGFVDGANLYQLVCSNPIERIDVLGLGPLSLLYTGHWSASDEEYEAATTAAGAWLFANSPVRGGFVGVGYEFEGNPNARLGVDVAAEVSWSMDDGVGTKGTVAASYDVLQDRHIFGGYSTGLSGGIGISGGWDEEDGWGAAVGGGVGDYENGRPDRDAKPRSGGAIVSAETDGSVTLGLTYGPVMFGITVDPSYFGEFYDAWLGLLGLSGEGPSGNSDGSAVSPSTTPSNGTSTTDLCPTGSH